MSNVNPLESIPIWSLFVVTSIILVLAIGAGILLARFWTKNLENQNQDPVNTVVGATLGLLAFILAFTFGLASSRFDTRKDFLLDEVNAIETVFLRAALIPEPYSTNARNLLREYVEVRVELARHPETIAAAIRQSERLQGLLWSQATALSKHVEDLKNVAMARLFVSSLNNMLDLQTKRITVTLVHRTPLVFWVALFSLSLLAMIGVGYIIGLSARVNWILIVVLSLSFSIVIVLIVDLDRSGTGKAGLTQVNQQPMFDLQKRIGTPKQSPKTGSSVPGTNAPSRTR